MATAWSDVTDVSTSWSDVTDKSTDYTRVFCQEEAFLSTEDLDWLMTEGDDYIMIEHGDRWGKTTDSETDWYFENVYGVNLEYDESGDTYDSVTDPYDGETDTDWNKVDDI